MKTTLQIDEFEVPACLLKFGSKIEHLMPCKVDKKCDNKYRGDSNEAKVLISPKGLSFVAFESESRKPKDIIARFSLGYLNALTMIKNPQ